MPFEISTPLNEENFLDYLSEWAIADWDREIQEHIGEYPSRISIEDEELHGKQIVTWFMLEWVNPRTGTTILAEFIEKFVKDPALAAKVGQLNGAFYSTFLFTRQISNDLFVITDQVTKKTYRLRFAAGLPGSWEDLILNTYIHPWDDDGTYVTAGVSTLSHPNPYGFITPDMHDALFRRFLREKQDAAEALPIPRKMFTYLKNQPIELVNSVSDFLNVPEGKKRERINAISAAMSSRGASVLESSSKMERSCLLYVYGFKDHVTKHKELERLFSDDDYNPFSSQRSRSVIGRLRERGLLMVGRKIILNRKYKVAAVPAEILPALDGLSSPSEDGPRRRWSRP